jgi:hypothetical protein
MRFILALAFAAAAASAQSNRTVTLTWTASPTAGVTGYNMYRAPGACAANGTAAKINPAPIAGLTFTDSVPVGIYCYHATALGGGLESGPSPKSEASVSPAAPGPITITIQVAVNVTVDGVKMAQKDFTVVAP